MCHYAAGYCANVCDIEDLYDGIDEDWEAISEDAIDDYDIDC